MADFEQSLDTIRLAFEEKELPGVGVMREMAPIGRKINFTLQEGHSIASVMLMLYKKKEELYFPLIVRASNNSMDKHSGQIALPGGKKESSDQNDWSCALRETQEEIGIQAEKVELIGALTNHYIPVSNFRVFPFVGFFSGKPEFSRQEDEVDSIIEAPLQFLLDQGNKKTGTIRLANGVIIDEIPYFDLWGHKVWGATAMMLNEFVRLIRPK